MSRVFVAIESALGCVTLAADESDVYIMEIALTYALPNGLCA